jgi:hypothetical protein
MSSSERESLMFLEPELRQSRLAQGASRRAMPPMLERTMLLLRFYVVVSVAVVIIALIRGVH